MQLSSLSGITAISAGFGHSLFLKNDSTVWGCGLNLSGPLGTGATSITESTPVQVSTVSAITKISAGAHFSLFLKNNGTIYACGDNDYGQLGDGTVIDRHSPVPINSLSGIADIAAGAGTAYSLFLKNDNTVWVCGVNSGGQFGIGSSSGFNPNSTPVQITALNGIIDISAGQYHSMHLKNDGTAKGSGGNASGQIGNGTFVNTTSLVSVTNMCATAIGIKEVAEKLFFKTCQINETSISTVVSQADMVGHKIFTKSEIPVTYSGGDRKLNKLIKENLNTRLPLDQGAKSDTYKIIIRFIVRIDGTSYDFKPETKFGFGMEEEAIRLLKNIPTWNPAIQNGHKVNAYYRQMVIFDL